MARKTWGRSFWSTLSLLFRDREDAPEPVVVEESFTIGEAPSSGTVSRSGSRDPSQSIIKKIGLAIADGEGGSRDFSPPEYNFQEITDAYNTEGYVRQALDKYIEMMFKAGWDFVGKNPNAVDYIKMRFKLMAEATQIPTNQLFLEIAEDLVKYSNVIIAKARAKDNLPFQGLNVSGVGENMPVAGYFPINVSTIQVKRDKFGVVKGWQQEVEGQDKPVKFKPQDIVHIYYKREKGRAFGTPFLLPALDDIRALRQIEENVLRLVYRNLHPLWHVKVGLDKEGLGAEDGEVDEVRQEVENMDIEGGLVTTERVNISAIASNQIIDANEYMNHFEQRVFTVMGVSELMMGRGNTANRSTGDNLSGEFTDRVKALQKVQMTYVDEFMIKELLMEGGFDPVLNPDDAVSFTFREIDKDSQIKAENQAVFLYEHNAISEDEMRELLGRDPIEDGEQRTRMHLQIITLATLEAEAALAPAPATGSASSSTASKKKATDNKTKPSNQYGTKPSPKKATNSNEDPFKQLFYKEMFGIYTDLNDATLRIVKRYYDEESSKQIEALHGAMIYSTKRFRETLKHRLGEDVLESVEIPIMRMVEELDNKISSTLTSMVTNEAYRNARDTSQAIFDVFTDRLGFIIDKAFKTYSEKEVDSDAE